MPNGSCSPVWATKGHSASLAPNPNSYPNLDTESYRYLHTHKQRHILLAHRCVKTLCILDRLHFLLTWDHGERRLTSFFRDVTHKILRVDQPRLPFQVLLCPQGQQLVQNLSGVQIARVRGTGLNNLLHPGQGMALLLLLLSDRRPILRECEMKTHLLLDAREAFLQKSDVLLA